MAALLRLLALLVATAAVVSGLAAVGLYAIGSARLSAKLSVPNESVAVPNDVPSLRHGQHLASAVALCLECHGPNLAGSVVFDQRDRGRVVAPNLPRGRGGVGASRSDADVVRAIRQGVDPTGRPLLMMPSDQYFDMSDADAAAIVEYIRSTPPIDTTLPPTEISVLGRILFAAGRFPLIPAARIDHFAPRPTPPPPGPTRDYGRYLVEIAGCGACHAPGLVPLGSWSEAEFLRIMRTGTRPDGRVLNDAMPWQYFAQMTEDELAAIWTFLELAPPAR